MNKYLSNMETKTKQRLEWMLDALSLGAVLQYAIYRFLQSTMFNFYYSNMYKLITMGLLLIFGGIRYLYIVIDKLKGYEEKKDRIRYLLRCGGAWLLAIPFFYVGLKHDYKVLVFLPVCCMCLYEMQAEKVCKWFFISIGICLLSLVLCALSGTVQNIVNPWERYVGAFGSINTTDLASYFSLLLLAAWCAMHSHKWKNCLLFSIMTAVVTCLVWNYTASKTAVIVGVLTILFVIWDCVEENVLWKHKRLCVLGKGINWLSVLAFPTVGIVVIFLAVGYANQDAWVLQIEGLLTGRIETVLKPYSIYGIKAFGNTIMTMHGGGGITLDTYSWSSGYGYIDVAYAMMAIRYGWVITAIICSLWIWVTVNALKSGKNRFAFTMVILAVHGFSESRILDINYNIFLVMPFCTYTYVQGKKKKTEQERTSWVSIITGTVMVGCIYLLLPRLLSWLRSFFYLLRWNEGTAAAGSFLFCVCFVFLLWLLWKSITRMLNEEGNKRIVSVVVIAACLVGSALLMNNTIENGREIQAERIKEEKEIINSIKKVAKLPIYAAEAEELYRRESIDVGEHIFSTEELGKSKGSIFVDRDIKSIDTILTGGKFAQISEWSGLYTYDPAVINAFPEYNWQYYNAGWHSVNLMDMAQFNNLPRIDKITISNGEKVETVNEIRDQFSGTYEVNFILSGMKTEKDGDIICLEVIGEAGDEIILQEYLSAGNFDENGFCEYSIRYKIETTPKVTYAVSTKENTTVTIEGINWKIYEYIFK